MEHCRAITFVNFHIPMTEMIDDKDIQYATIGFFDGMLTQKVEISDQKNELKNLWKYMLKRTAKSVGQYSYQNIFCFCQDGQYNCTDEQIWAPETDLQYPLTFVVFLQIQEYAHGENAIATKCLELNDKVYEKIRENGKCYTYNTIDKNDFVVCIKSRNYQLAVDAIKHLHTIQVNVVYSYSVFSISKEVLKVFDEKNYTDIFNESIASICLKGVTNSFDTVNNLTLDKKYREFCEKLVDKLYENTKDDYRVYDILGDDDFRLIARNIKLGRLLQEFAEGGLLNNHEKLFRFYLFSSSMVLNTDAPKLVKEIDEYKIRKTTLKMNQEFQAPHCHKLQEKMEKISAVIEEESNNEWNGQEEIATFCSAIWQLLQSLKALEIPATKKYDFWSIYYPLAQMVIILERKLKQGDNLLEIGMREEIYDFIHKISMTLHGTLRTDIQFFQIRDFNATVHYAPSKLRAFYSLWALRLSDYYVNFCNTNNKKSYSFILSPGMFSKTTIKQLFTNDAEIDRLMLIAVPERQLYTPKWLSIVLGHEVSHFVGTDVRQRPVRHDVMIAISARLLALEMNYYRYKVAGAKWKLSIEKIISMSNLYQKLRAQLAAENKEICRNWGNVNNKFHSDHSMDIIQETYQALAKTYLDKLISEDCEQFCKVLKSDNSNLPFGERSKIYSEITQVAYEMETPLAFFYQKFQGSLKCYLEMILHILKEACADINSILTLELKPEEYIKSFCSTGNYFDTTSTSTGKVSMRTIRIALVLESIRKGIENQADCFVNKKFVEYWNKFNIMKYSNSQLEDSNEEFISAWVYDFLESQKDWGKFISAYPCVYNYTKECFGRQIANCLEDDIIWNCMMTYGLSCVKEYVKKLSEEKMRSSTTLLNQKRVLVNTYQNIANGTISQQLQMIENFLYDCENHPFINKIEDATC